MDSLKQTKPVPFTQELEHLKKYLYIEKLRFGNKLNVEYDIQPTDFVLPQLSIQPIVENAVKHGVGMKEGQAALSLSRPGTPDDAYEIIIHDDGVGFDMRAPRRRMTTDVRMSAWRIRQRRLMDMCGGTIVVESEVGQGTTARITLPKADQPDIGMTGTDEVAAATE